jgi:hypothetical protein
MSIEKAYELGWRKAAEWANRDDLISDIDSLAYVVDMQKSLANDSKTEVNSELSDEFLNKLAISFTVPNGQIGCSYHYSRTTILALLRNLISTVEVNLRKVP